MVDWLWLDGLFSKTVTVRFKKPDFNKETGLLSFYEQVAYFFFMLSISIVNWNTGKLLAACLASLQRLPDSEKNKIQKIFIVDNQSSDDSFILAQQKATSLPVMFTPLNRNIGFAAANNKALQLFARLSGHVVLLNPDTEVKPGFIEHILTIFEHYPTVGVIGPQLVNSNGLLQPSVRHLPTLGVLTGLFLKLHRVMPRAKIWQNYFCTDFDYRRAQPVEQVMGAAFVIRDRLLKKNDPHVVGLLDERFWLWFEEVDFCKRAREAGWEILYTPKVRVMHHGGASFNQRVGLSKTVPFLMSATRYAAKHMGVVAAAWLLLLWPAALLLTLPASALHFRKRIRNRERL